MIATYSGRWPKASKTYLARPENRDCRIHGPTCTRVATLVDHRIPWRSGRTDAERQALFWDTAGNWRPVCFNCHNAKTVRDDQHRNADGTFGRAKA